jgi:hypothetical protein
MGVYKKNITHNFITIPTKALAYAAPLVTRTNR